MLPGHKEPPAGRLFFYRQFYYGKRQESNVNAELIALTILQK